MGCRVRGLGSQQGICPSQVFWSVDPEAGVPAIEHADADAVLEGAQLLEAFGAFEGRGW
jgi:hypothetical protein